MFVHCFDIAYQPNSTLDSYLEQWLTNWQGWAEESLDKPSEIVFTDYSGSEVTASGFKQNRFELDDTTRTVEEDRDVIIDQLTGETGYLQSYADWAVVRWHVCDHDESDKTGCGDWQVIHSHGQIPDEVF